MMEMVYIEVMDKQWTARFEGGICNANVTFNDYFSNSPI